MNLWLLIFYLSGYSAGGPAVAQFYSKESCERAAVLIKEHPKIGHRYDAHICVPQS